MDSHENLMIVQSFKTLDICLAKLELCFISNNLIFLVIAFDTETYSFSEQMVGKHFLHFSEC